MRKLLRRVVCTFRRHPTRTFLVHASGGTVIRATGCPCSHVYQVHRREGLKYPLPADRIQVVG